MIIATNEQYIQYLKKKGIRVGNNVVFRNPSTITIDFTRPILLKIGNNVDINENMSILTHDFGTYVFRNKYKDFVNSSGCVSIGDNVVIGRNVTILKGATIGNDSIVALGSVVTKPMPPQSVIAGCPARVICSLEDYYKRRKEKSIQEAINYGCEIIRYYDREPIIEDFTEEWNLFLTKEEYDTNPKVKTNVDFRLNGYVDIESFIHKKKPFIGFKSFLKAINDQYERN